MRIDAMVVRDKGCEFRLENLEIEEPRDEEVLVRIVATGMCHTDLVVRDLGICPFPSVLGHEGSGVVTAVGRRVKHVVPGDHVVLTFNSCGTCASCNAGHEAYCTSFNSLNLSGRRADHSTTLSQNGQKVFGSFFGQSSFGQYALAPARSVVRVRRDTPLEMLGPLGCGVQTGAGTVLNVLRPSADSSIAVFGAGAVGLSAVMAARLVGCSRIVAIDPVQSRLDLAMTLGATEILKVEQDGDVGAALTQGGALDYAVDTSGIPASIQLAVAAVSRQGTCALVSSGKPGAMVTFPLSQLSGGKRILSVIEGDSQPQSFIPRLLDLHLEGRLPFDRMIRFYDIGDINQAAADSLSGVTIKPVLRVGRPG